LRLKNYAILLLPLMLFTVSDAARPVRSPNVAAPSDEQSETQVSRTAVRTPAAPARAGDAQQRQGTGARREASPAAQARTAVPQRTVVDRSEAPARSAAQTRSAVPANRTIMRPAANQPATARGAIGGRPVIARTAVATGAIGTTGAAEYEACRSALFGCMDQFCLAKSEEFKRCSCSDTLDTIVDVRGELQRAQDRLVGMHDTMFTVTLGRAEAEALVRATEGEQAHARTPDNSANRRILDSVMESISGGTPSNLRTGTPISLEITEDMWMIGDAATLGVDLTQHSGRALFNMVFSMCRPMIGEACRGRGHLDRAQAAYDILVEQDCGTLARALRASGRALSDNVRQTSVQLSAARIDNFDAMNSLSEGECLSELKKAMLADNACGANYRYCLDTGRFFDRQTGKILPTATNLSQLRDMITFSASGSTVSFDRIILSGEGLALQRLISSKLDVVSGPILDRCDAIRDQVRQKYLEMAMAEIHYVHMEKLDEFKGVCMNDVRACYDRFGPSIRELASAGNVRNILDVYISADSVVAIGQQEACAVKIYQCDELIGIEGETPVEDFIAAVVDYAVERDCAQMIRNCFSTLGGPQYLNFLKPDPTRGVVFEVGRGKQAVLQGFGQTRSGEFYNSLCFNIFEQARPCQTISVERRRALFGTFDFRFNSNDSSVMLDLTSIDRAVNNAQTAGIAGEVYKMIQAELNSQCQMRGGTFRPLSAPFTNPDTIAIISRLNTEAKDRIARNSNKFLLTFLEADNSNFDVDCIEPSEYFISDSAFCANMTPLPVAPAHSMLTTLTTAHHLCPAGWRNDTANLWLREPVFSNFSPVCDAINNRNTRLWLSGNGLCRQLKRDSFCGTRTLSFTVGGSMINCHQSNCLLDLDAGNIHETLANNALCKQMNSDMFEDQYSTAKSCPLFDLTVFGGENKVRPFQIRKMLDRSDANIPVSCHVVLERPTGATGPQMTFNCEGDMTGCTGNCTSELNLCTNPCVSTNASCLGSSSQQHSACWNSRQQGCTACRNVCNTTHRNTCETCRTGCNRLPSIERPDCLSECHPDFENCLDWAADICATQCHISCDMTPCDNDKAERDLICESNFTSCANDCDIRLNSCVSQCAAARQQCIIDEALSAEFAAAKPSIVATQKCPSDWENIVDVFSWGICDCGDRGVGADGRCVGN